MRGLIGLVRRLLRPAGRTTPGLADRPEGAAVAIAPPPFPGLPPAPPVPHTSGPLSWPTREECGVCARYRSAVRQATGLGYAGHAASYRRMWERHCTQILHRETVEAAPVGRGRP
ncbi:MULTISPECIES: hypothetical protein [Streptomyces]|uniref:Uncharacterized protein n=1 Tax=Streptomyces ehimensis TaxID=68195 RepID=A0ABV9BL60_9ACTN